MLSAPTLRNIAPANARNRAFCIQVSAPGAPIVDTDYRVAVKVGDATLARLWSACKTTCIVKSMKLLRVGTPGKERPALLDATGVIRDLSSVVTDIAGDALLPDSLARIRKIDAAGLPAVHRIAAARPVRRRRRQVHLRRAELLRSRGRVQHGRAGRADHLHEGDVEHFAVPYDDVELPRGSQKSDWEVELGVVIGKPAKYVSEADAMSHVAGYCVVNDLSERAFQLEGTGQWVKGKSADTFGPIGPWLVTADEIAGLPEPRAVARSGRPSLPERHDEDDGVRRAVPRELPEPLHEPAVGRRHQHRHAARRRRWARSRPCFFARAT